MPLATQHAQAPAALKRGGGPSLPPTTLPQLKGRQQGVKGGVKKSLCCAAAGIINPSHQRPQGSHTPRQACAGRAPTTAPLRSIPRPHAQLVMGYTHLSTARQSAAQAAGVMV